MRRKKVEIRAVPRNNERKRKRGQGKAEDAGGLTPVQDNNAALRFLDR